MLLDAASARALARGDAAGALALGRRAAPRLQNDLALQRLMARARSALPGAAPETAPEGFCRAPFENLETAPGGDVFFCCPAWLPKPIGNLGDLSPRAASVLRAVSAVAAEDTRHTLKLFAHLGAASPAMNIRPAR